MNRKYKGGGCGCGASRSLGFPQTGGLNTSFANNNNNNNSGLFKNSRNGGQKMPMANSFVGGGNALNFARGIFNISQPPASNSETPLTTATGPNTAYPPITNIVRSSPPSTTLPTPNVATAVPTSAAATASPVLSNVNVKNGPGFTNYGEGEGEGEGEVNTNPFIKGASNLLSIFRSSNQPSGGRRTRRNKNSKKAKNTKKAKKAKKAKKTKSRR